MSNVLAFRPRDMGTILAEIMATEGKLRRAEQDWYVTKSDLDSDRANDHEDRLYALRAEAIAMVERQVGVTWDALQAALS